MTWKKCRRESVRTKAVLIGVRAPHSRICLVGNGELYIIRKFVSYWQSNGLQAPFWADFQGFEKYDPGVRKVFPTKFYKMQPKINSPVKRWADDRAF